MATAIIEHTTMGSIIQPPDLISSHTIATPAKNLAHFSTALDLHRTLRFSFSSPKTRLHRHRPWRLILTQTDPHCFISRSIINLYIFTLQISQHLWVRMPITVVLASRY